MSRAGIRVGVCAMPRVGDGALAAALARQGIAQVHGLAADAQIAAAARKPAAERGMLGSQVVIETGIPSAIPLGDWVADLLVVADATDANLNAIPPAEVRRVVAPYRGVAVVGNPGGGKSGLSKEALTRWAGETGAKVLVQEDATGLWAVIRMPPLEGGDDWGHHTHAADGNLVSEDKAFGPAPFELQWTGKPYYGGHWDIHVVSAGRMFTAQCSVFQHPRLPYELVARSAYNGQVLWRRPIAQDFGESASLVVATPQRLFLKDAGAVLVLDPETGAEMRRITVTSDAAQHCLWLLVSDGVLLTVTGPIQKYSKDADDYTNSPPKRKAQDEVNELYAGRELAAWDTATGAELWRFTEKNIDPPKVVAANGRVYLYAARLYAACLDLKSGRQIWKTAAPIAEPKGLEMGWIDGHATVKNMSIHRQGAVATKDVYFINYLPHRQCQAFSTADGRLLWDRMHGPVGNDAKEATLTPGKMMFGYNVVLGQTIIERKEWQKSSDIFDLLTGKPLLPATHFSYGGCGRFTALASGLLFGQSGEVYDFKANKPVLFYNAKSSCGTGQFVADGLLFKVGANCSGCSEWRGFYVSRSVPRRETSGGARLEKGAAGEPKDVTGDVSDWLTYRSDATRKGSSAAMVPAGATVRWTFASTRPALAVLAEAGGYLEPDRNPTPPISMGERVWFGTAEGAVVCVDRKTGVEAWRYWTAGQIMSSPTWWQGRVYAGSCDGWVYCLDAASGTLAWRYRVAPDERRIMVLGHLSSAWPIMANVLVQDGAVFAAGGYIGQIGGSVLCSLDVRTGEPRWEKRFDAASIAPSASGQLAWYAGRLWWHVGDSGILVADPATGDVRPAVESEQFNKKAGATWSGSRGQDIGILPGGWVVFGGRQFNLPLNDVQPRNNCCFLRADPGGAAVDQNGLPKVIVLNDNHAVDAIPVWDAGETLLFGKPADWKVEAIDPMLCRGLAAVLAGGANVRPEGQWNSGAKLAAKLDLAPDQQRGIWPEGKRFRSFHSPVLAANAVVFLTGEGNKWRIVAVSRADRRPLWDVELPGQPLLHGLALTRAGGVLAPLTDGRVVCVAAEVP